MTNPYYSPSGNPATGSQGLSSLMRSEFATISAAFDLLPVFTANGGKVVVVNPGGTALTVTVGTLALAGNLSTTGAFNTIFAQGASVTLTLPVVNGTLATLAGTETLSNKTLVAPALGTPASGVATNLTGTAAGLTAGTATNQSGGSVAATTLSASGAVSGAGFVALHASPGPIGSTAASTGAFTTLSATSTVSGAGFTAWAASPPAIGGTVPAAGAFTTMSASGAVSGAGFTALFASPPAIGGSAPAAGAFTTLSTTGILTTLTAAPGTNTTQAATTAYSTAAIVVEASARNTAIAVETTARIAANRGLLGGMSLSNDGGTPNTVLDISAGTCTDSTSAATITLGAFTKTTGGVWVLGTGNAGMGTGVTIANSTWYHVFAVIVSGVADVYFDANTTAANRPAGTTAFRRIGSFRTNGSAQIIAFSQNGDEFLWAATVLDVSVVPPASAVLAALTVPTGVKVNALFRASYGDSLASSGIIFTSPDENDQAPLSTAAGLSLANPQTSGAFPESGQFNVRTNTSAQIRYRASATTSNAININTYGYMDTRGRFL